MCTSQPRAPTLGPRAPLLLQVQELCSLSLREALSKGSMHSEGEPDLSAVLWMLLDIAQGLQVRGGQGGFYSSLPWAPYRCQACQ